MRILRTKYFSVIYDHGVIRRIQSADVEIVRMIFSAVRDRNWGTVEPQIVREEISQFEEGFSIHLTVNYIQAEIHFQAEYLIAGKENRLSFEMNGKAVSAFLKNRIGICVLHPIPECAGKTATVVHPDGVEEMFEFPKLISPTQPVKNIRELKWTPSKGIIASLQFEGDVFEMEDQRNWIDASYKTYCTPLDFPFPVKVKMGEKSWQKVVLEIDTSQAQVFKKEEVFPIEWDESKPMKLPKIGLGVSSRKQSLTKSEADVLSNLSIDHLRADIHLHQKNWKKEMRKAANESKLLNVPLFLCLYFDEDFEKQLKLFLAAVKEQQLHLETILIVGNDHLPHIYFEKITAAIRCEIFDVKIGTGVNAYFAELNRNRPPIEKADFISFTACPQVHAFDDMSLFENMEGLGEAVLSAKAYFPDKPVYVSPITLKQRFNVVATTVEPAPKAGELPSQVDVRQASEFAALWTLGSIKQLALEGAQSVDFYETVGWRGILQGDIYSSNPELFISKPGDIYPVFHLFKWIKDAQVCYPIISANSKWVDGLILEKDGFNELVLINLTNETRFVQIENHIEILQVFRLDGETFLDNHFLTTSNIELSPKEIFVIQFVPRDPLIRFLNF